MSATTASRYGYSNTYVPNRIRSTILQRILCAARPPDIVAKLKVEGGPKKKRKSQSQKVKAKKRKREEENTPKKKPRIQSRQVEQRGEILNLEDTIVKTESGVN